MNRDALIPQWGGEIKEIRQKNESQNRTKMDIILPILSILVKNEF